MDPAEPAARALRGPPGRVAAPAAGRPGEGAEPPAPSPPRPPQYPLNKDLVKQLMFQLVRGVAHCHRHGVMHRDLKLDNTLLDDSSPPYIKICDFGFAKSWGTRPEDANTTTTIGTPVYMSPEVLSTAMSGKAYLGTSADVWSSGVLLFVMLMGAFPFDHTANPDPDSNAAQREVLMQQITTSWRDCVNQPEVKRLVDMLSDDAKDLLDHMFVTDARNRFTIEQVKEHPWMTRALPEHYQKALDLIDEEQVIVDEELARRQTPQFMSAMKHRNLKVRGILEESKRAGTGHAALGTITEGDDEAADAGAVRRVDLRQDIDIFEKSKSFAALAALAGGVEEGSRRQLIDGAPPQAGMQRDPAAP